MDRIYVVFWTQSGNTQAMAQAVAEGITAAGKTPELVFVSEIPADALKDEAAFALGCPAMGAEVLEESEMEPFVMAVETFAKGKKIALCGDLAADLSLTEKFIQMGIDELSVAPNQVLALRKKIREIQ